MTETTHANAEVLAAVAKAMGSVRRIAKEGMNTHDKYKFASIDDFLAALNPICAEAGLVFHMQEAEREDFTRAGKYGDTHWIRFRFEITVYHVSGGSLPPVSRSVEVIRSGAQAFGSAQSYALKQFMRSLLLVPTGDKEDADYGEQSSGAPRSDARRDPPPPAPSPDPQAEAERIIGAINAAPTLDALRETWGAVKTAAGNVNASDANLGARILAARDARIAALTPPPPPPPAPTGSLADDTIPF